MKKKILAKRILSFILICSMIIILPGYQAKAYVSSDSGILEPGSTKDVYINVDDAMLDAINTASGMTKTADDISKDVKQYLIDNYKDNDVLIYSEDNLRIRNGVTKIDTTDLSSWYVYDHYDTASGGYSSTDAMFTSMRPYFGYAESYGGAITTIKDAMTASGGDLSTFSSVKTLKEHIYSYEDDGKANMVMVGYGSPAYTDFLYYSAQTEENKNIKFDVDSSCVNTHSLEGSGFLINTGIDAQGYIHGYLIYLAFNSSTSASVSLYKINSGVLASSLHDSGNVVSSCTYVSGLGTISGSNTHLDITFNDTELTFKATPILDSQGTLGDTVTNQASMTSTGDYGFGPLVQYSSHSCSSTSVYAFKNLEMSLQMASNIFEALKTVQFYNTQTTDRYFVNLTSEDMASGEDFWEGIARLRSDKIFYVSNGANTSDVISSTDPDSAANGSNGLDIEGETDYNTLIQKIAQYIAEGEAWSEADLSKIESSTPVAVFDIVGSDNNVTNTVLDKIERKMLDDNPITISINNKSTAYDSVNEIEIPVDSITYTFTGPDNSVLETKTVDYDSSELYTLDTQLTEDSVAGTYKIALQATKGDKTSTTITRTFQLIEDTEAPTFDTTEIDSKLVDDVYPENSLSLVINDSGWGVQAYQIGYGETESTAVWEDEKVLTELADSYTLSISSIGSRNEKMFVRAWDWVGNLGTYSVKVNPAVNTVTFSKSNYYGVDLTDADMPTISDQQLNASIDLTTYNSTSPKSIAGYEFVGYNTSKNAKTCLTTKEITSSTTTLYPIYKVSTEPVITVNAPDGMTLPYITANANLSVKASAYENAMIASVKYSIKQYSLDTQVGTLSDTEIEATVDQWNTVENEKVSLSQMESGNQYMVFVKAEDEDGNVTYKQVKIIFDSVAPSIKVNGTVIPDQTGTDYTANLTTKVQVLDNLTDVQDLVVSYKKNGGDATIVTDLDNFSLIPDENGATDTYEITVKDEAGNVTTRTIVLESYKSVLSIMSTVTNDNVTIADKTNLLAALEKINNILAKESTETGASTTEIDALKARKNVIEANLVVVKELEVKAAADQAVADVTEQTVDAIGTIEYTDACKDRIAAARAAYDALTDDQKALVSAEELKKLTDAEAVFATIEKLEAIGTVEYTDEFKIEIDAVRAKYDALTDDQKALVSTEELAKLTDAEAVYGTIDKVENIGTVEYTDECKENIVAARTAYDALTDDQKALIGAEELTKLTDAEAAYAALEATDEAAKAKEAFNKNSIALNAKFKVKQTGNKIEVSWAKVSNASGYYVYVQYCGKKFTKVSKNVKSKNITKVKIKKVNGKKLNLKKNYKVYVVAYRTVDGSKYSIAESIRGHIVGKKNAKFTNAKGIKLSKSKYSLKVGKTVKISAKTILVDKNRKQLSDRHAKEFRYTSTDKSVATVTSKGKIKAAGVGTCYIYVYSRNGYAKKTKVTVK